MRPAAPARIALAATAAFIIALAAIDLRLRAGDEGGQAVDAVGDRRLRLRRLRLILRLRTMFAMLTVTAMLARLLVALIRPLVAVALVVVAHIGLRRLLLRRKARLLAERRESVALILAFLGRHVVVGARLLLQMLRRLGLEGTQLAKAQCTTIRLKLLKIGALIRITVRKVWISLAGGYPHVELFRQVYEKLCAMPLKC